MRIVSKSRPGRCPVLAHAHCKHGQAGQYIKKRKNCCEAEPHGSERKRSECQNSAGCEQPFAPLARNTRTRYARLLIRGTGGRRDRHQGAGRRDVHFFYFIESTNTKKIGLPIIGRSRHFVEIFSAFSQPPCIPIIGRLKRPHETFTHDWRGGCSERGFCQDDPTL